MKEYVTDGVTTFHNYCWNRKGQIKNIKTKKVVDGYINNFGLKVIVLRTDEGKIVGRSYDKLKKFSFRQKYLPKNFERYVDVYGHENLYCFDPKDPTKVFSKKNLEFKKILLNTDGYQFIRVGKGSLYLHVMVYQSMNKLTVNKDMYQIHHISGNKKQNNIENLMLVTRSEHKAIHKAERIKNEQNTHN